MCMTVFIYLLQGPKRRPGRPCTSGLYTKEAMQSKCFKYVIYLQKNVYIALCTVPTLWATSYSTTVVNKISLASWLQKINIFLLHFCRIV